MSQLFDAEIYIRIGDRDFCIPRDLFSGPGDSPNFFSLGFAVWWSNPKETFPGVDRSSLLRPPPVAPPAVPNRSGDVFADIVHLLHGYPMRFRDEDHRANVLRDCRYYHLRGLEQKIIPHDISDSPLRERGEIIIRLDDVRQSGLQFENNASSPLVLPQSGSMGGCVTYSRPFVDEKARELIIEIGGESTRVDPQNMRADFLGLTKARVSKLFQVVADKVNVPNKAPLGLRLLYSPQSPLDTVIIQLDDDTHIIVDGEEKESQHYGTLATLDGSYNNGNYGINDNGAGEVDDGQQRPLKRKRVSTVDLDLQAWAAATAAAPDFGHYVLASNSAAAAAVAGGGASGGAVSMDWVVRTGQWRLRVQPNGTGTALELVFVAVKLDIYTTQQRKNRMRRFLG